MPERKNMSPTDDASDIEIMSDAEFILQSEIGICFIFLVYMSGVLGMRTTGTSSSGPTLWKCQT